MVCPGPITTMALLIVAAFAVIPVQGADNDVEQVRNNPFVTKDDLGPLMRNYDNESPFGKSIIPGFQRDSTFTSNPSGCLSCTYGSGSSRTFGLDSLPRGTSTRREFRKEQKFVNGQPVYDFHHERHYEDGQLVHEDRNVRGDDDLGSSSQNLGFLEQQGLGRVSYQGNSQSSTSDSYQSSSSGLNRFGSDDYIIPQSSSTREEFRKEQKFVNGQPVYDLQHERRFQDGHLVHEEKQERDEDDFGVSRGISDGIGHEHYSSTSRQSSIQSQSSNIGDSGNVGADFNADTSRLRQKLQEQMRTFRTRPRLSTVGTSEKTETRTESRRVNGLPIYERNEERRYENDNLIHSNVEEKGPDDFGTRHLINSAAHGTYSTGRSRSNQQRYNNQQQYQQSGISSNYPAPGSQQGAYITREQSQEQRSTSYRPSYVPTKTSIPTQQSGQHSSTSYRPSYTPSRTSQPSNRPSGSSVYDQPLYSNNRPYSRRTDYSHKTNQQESSQNSQIDQTYGSTYGSSYRPTGSSTTYREESQNKESATYLASRPSSSDKPTSITNAGENISHSSSYELPSVSPSRRAEGDKPPIYEHSYFARTNAERRKAISRDRSRGVYNGPRRVNLDLSETNGLNEHLVGSSRHNSQSSYDGSSQYSSGLSNERSHTSSSYDGSYGRSSSYDSNTDSNISTVSSVGNNHIDTEYDDHYTNSDDEYGSDNEDYVYEDTNTESSYNEDENNNRLNKERYDISPYDGIENIPEVANEVETSYSSPDSHSQPEPTDYNTFDEEETHDRQDHYEQITTESPSDSYNNQIGDGAAQGYPHRSHTSSSSGFNYTSYNRVVPSTDHHQSSYDYSNNEVQQSSYQGVPYGAHESSSINHQERQEQSSISSDLHYAPSSSSSLSSSRATEERRENVFNSGVQGPGVIISSPHTKTRRTELRTKKKYVNGQLIGLTFYERVYENGNLVHENITERGRDDLTQEELQQYGISMAEFDQPIYNQGGSYSKKQEVTQQRKFVNGQQIYDLHHERKYEDGRLVHENRTEKDEDDLGVSGYNRHGSSGYAVGINTDYHNVAQSQYGSSGYGVDSNTGDHSVAQSQYGSSGYSANSNTEIHNVAESQYGSSGYAVGSDVDTQNQYNNQNALAGTVQHSSEDRQVTDRHIVNTVPHYTSRREEVRTQQKFVNGVPVYDLQQERKYVDGQLVHENKTELDEDELRIRFGHRDALKDILAGNTLSTVRDKYYFGNAGNYGSTAYGQSQSSSTQSRTSTGRSSGQGISGGAQTVALDLGSGGHQSQSSYSDSSSQVSSSGYGTDSLTSIDGAGTTDLGIGSAASDSSTYRRGGGVALTSVMDLGSVGSGVQGGHSSYSSSSTSENESRSTSVGGGYNFDSSNLAAGSSRAYGEQQSSHGRSSHGASQMGTSLLNGHSSAGSGGARTMTLDLGSSSSQASQSQMGTSLLSGHSSAGSGGARTMALDLGSSSSQASQMGTSLLSGHSSAGSGGARTMALDLGSLSSQASQMGTSLLSGHSSAGSGGARTMALDLGSSSSQASQSQMGTALLSGHSSAGSGGARTMTLDLGSSSSTGLGNQLLGSDGHQTQLSHGGSSTYESGSSYSSSSSSSGSSGCISCTLNTGGNFGASASGLTGGHTFSQGHEMSKEERYENGELVHGHESERDFENGQLVREQSRQYGGRNADQPIGAMQGGHISSSSSSFSSSSQSSYDDANGIRVKTTVSGSSEGVCADNPCQNGGSCIAGLRGALCVCPFGFKGKRCDEAYCPTRFCRYKGVCSIEDNQHVCSCRDGHTGLRCGTRRRRHTSKHRRRHASNP